MLWSRKSVELPTHDRALPGRAQPIASPGRHYVNNQPMQPPYPEGMEELVVGMGCFWGAERRFWELQGVHVTAVGYAAGFTPNPTYEEVCSGRTGHNEVVRVVYDPQVVSLEQIMRRFWEGHDPTQGMRQGNDVGTQYRSGVYYTSPDQLALIETTRERFQAALYDRRLGHITTEIAEAPTFYFAEEYHQQYLAKNPGGYCGLGGTGAKLPA